MDFFGPFLAHFEAFWSLLGIGTILYTFKLFLTYLNLWTDLGPSWTVFDYLGPN